MYKLSQQIYMSPIERERDKAFVLGQLSGHVNSYQIDILLPPVIRVVLGQRSCHDMHVFVMHLPSNLHYIGDLGRFKEIHRSGSPVVCLRGQGYIGHGNNVVTAFSFADLVKTSR